jgi:predicted GTPase
LRNLSGSEHCALDGIETVRVKMVLAEEDGASIPHGGMAYGADYVTTAQAQATQIVDSRAAASKKIAAL